MASELIHRNHTPEMQETESDFARASNPSRKPRNTMILRRVPFLLIGVVIAALFFQIFPQSASSPAAQATVAEESEMAFPTRRILMEEKRMSVPRGLKGKRKRILVTGGAGFVGSHLVDRLIERGDSVIVVDNFFTGRKENLIHHFGNPRFELIRHDVVEPILLEVDQIYHLACPASPVHYKFNPVKTIISFIIQILIILSLLLSLVDILMKIIFSKIKTIYLLFISLFYILNNISF